MTFLFTDIEGSTRRWEADAEAMRAALSRHDQVLQTAIESHDGFIFSHTGDGVVAAFASPKAAVDAAVAAQRKLELPVRMGIATGEAELRDDDYFGTVLNRAARVMAAGHGGQILVADSTAVLLSRVDLVDLGPRRLRDVPIPVGVFQVRAEGLGTDFPPLRALDTTPGNLRPATTSLIGRDHNIAEIKTTVRSHRLVTLTGVGGVGKTRLALEVAAQLADEFPDGAWVFELAAVTDPASVPDAVAAVLGITQQPGKTVRESVATALEGRSRLLIFDNCEHVLDTAADMLEAILSHSQTVNVLATSREGLRVADEQVWPVPALDAAAGIHSAAVNLFVERTQGIAPGFSMADGDEAAAVIEICKRLDGIPLAIELAASRIASMSARDVRDRLDHRFRLLVGSGRGSERHQTLRQAVAWSFELLDEAEKVLLARCSVFAGGFDLESACAVAESDGVVDDYAVLDLLDALVRKSLLVVDRSVRRTRYSMLETIRQFAEDQLTASGQVDEARAAHARYFAECEADILALWDSPRQPDAYAWFTTELPDLRTAFRWAADHDDLNTAAVIATYAAFLGFLIDRFEPIAWAEELIEPARAVNHPKLAFLYLMASASYYAGRMENAVRYADAATELLCAGRSTLPFDIDGWLNGAYVATGQPERAVEFDRKRLAQIRDTHHFTRSCLVFASTIRGASDEALAVADALIPAFEATDNPYVRCFSLLAYGWAFRDAQPIRALQALRRGLAIAQDSGNHNTEAQLASVLCRLERKYGEPVAALSYFRLAIRCHHESGNTTLLSTPLAVLSAFFDQLGRYEPSATIAGFAFGPVTQASFPELSDVSAHLRDVFGDQRYESLAREGETMTTAEMVKYAYDQIDQARAALTDVSK